MVRFRAILFDASYANFSRLTFSSAKFQEITSSCIRVNAVWLTGGNRRKWQNTCSSANSPATIITGSHLKLKMSLRGEKPAHNRLSPGTNVDDDCSFVALFINMCNDVLPPMRQFFLIPNWSLRVSEHNPLCRKMINTFSFSVATRNCRQLGSAKRAKNIYHIRTICLSLFNQ